MLLVAERSGHSKKAVGLVYVAQVDEVDIPKTAKPAVLNDEHDTISDKTKGLFPKHSVRVANDQRYEGYEELLEIDEHALDDEDLPFPEGKYSSTSVLCR